MITRLVSASSITLLFAAAAWAVNPGEWPMPRRDGQLTGHAPGKADMTKAPIQIATYDLGRLPLEWSFLDDVTGNDQLEILYPAGDGVRAMTPKGDHLWTGPHARPIMVADFDGNKTPEVLFQGPSILDGKTGRLLWTPKVKGTVDHRIQAGRFLKDSSSYQLALVTKYRNENHAYFYDFAPGVEKPKLVWHRKINESSTQDDCTTAVGYLTGRDRPILAAAVIGGLIVIDLATGEEISRFDWEVLGEKMPNYGQLFIRDIQGDSKNEFLLLNDVEAQQLAVLQLDDDLNLDLIWNEYFGHWYPQGEKLIDICPNPLGDVDGDGAVDIVISVHENDKWHLEIRDAATGLLKMSLENYVADDLIDFEGDGVQEVLTMLQAWRRMIDVGGAIPLRPAESGLESQRLATLTGAGYPKTPVFRYPVGQGGRFGKARRVIMDDADQDGILDFALGAYDIRRTGGANQFSLGGFNATGNLTAKSQWRVSPSREVSFIGLGDMDNDGIPDAVLVAKDGSVTNMAGGKGTRTIGVWNAAGRFRVSPIVVNLDGKGINEIIIPTADRKVAALRLAENGKTFSKIWAVDGVSIPAPRELGPSIVAANIKGTDEVELLTAASAKDRKASLRTIRSDGEYRWRCTLEGSFWPYTDYPIARVTVGRFTGRGQYDDVIVTLQTAFNGNASSISHGILADFGDVEWTNTGADTAFEANAVGPDGLGATYDLNKDGKDDVFFCSAHKLYCLDGATGKLLQAPIGFADVFTESDNNWTANGSIIPINALGDEQPELLWIANDGAFGLMTLDRKPIWFVDPSINDQAAPYHPGLADVDGDGQIELGMPVGNEFHCYDLATGKLEWKITEKDVGRTDVATADIDGDGKAEFLVCGSRDIIAIKADKQTGRILWRVEAGPAPCSPIPANVDADPELEILVTTYDGILRVFDSAPAQ